MNTYFNLLSKDLKKLWGGLEFPQRLTIILLIVAATVVISYILAKSTEPNWGVLYSDLSENDAIAVIENLKKAGYPYKLSEDKKTILVPVDLKEDLRIMITENDVIHDSNPGFELLDKVQLGATDFQNKLTRQRIFQGELVRTIERIRGVKKARVQIADPERSVFSEKDESPSASVMLVLEAGEKIKPEQVKVIKNLVSHAIPRLDPERVFVSDQNGTALTEEIGKNSEDIGDYRSTFEKNTSKKISKVLEKLVGESNISVEVSAILNFDRTKTTIEKYLPANENTNSAEGVISNIQSDSETYGNGGETQQAPTNGPVDDKKGKNYQKVKTSKSFNVSKEIKQVVYAPGTVERMTIAVALNKILTSKEKEEIKNLVISASGANLERGDLITITAMQFASDNETEVSSASEIMSDIEKRSEIAFWIKSIAPILTVLILGLTALFIFSSLIKKPIYGEEVYERGGGSDEYEGEREPDLLEAASISSIETKLDPELEKIRTDLNGVIMSNPVEAARLLLSYIKE
ncbi:MAG: flagellar basal-body MS-ring/collar protein FliF [bacterium]